MQTYKEMQIKGVASQSPGVVQFDIQTLMADEK